MIQPAPDSNSQRAGFEVERPTFDVQEPRPIHARSVTLASDSLGVVAKLDLVEATGSQATPVDYKRGRPRRAMDGTLEAWEPERVQICLQALAHRAERVERSDSLLGIEGTAARIYFQHFAGMLKPGDEPLDPGGALGEPPRFAFSFDHRNRRPPRDPVNAMLSLAYALLAKDLTVTAAAVGFDPYLGF